MHSTILLLLATTLPLYKSFTTLPPSSSPSSSTWRSTSTCRSTSTSLLGIPKMFRWLTDQYPTINKSLSTGLGPQSSPRQVDNFYLDMNGIIHPCTHNNEKSSVVILDETAMFKKIFSYVDLLFKIVRPTSVMYLAVDGVAPRAKMNQQRGRRFRSGQEAEEVLENIIARGELVPEGDKFDSNCITPGTDFMLKLSLAMNRWIEYELGRAKRCETMRCDAM